MNRYVVDVPVRGVQTLIVYAETAAEAKEKVNSLDSPDVEGIDFNVTWSGKANYARLEEKNVEKPKR